MIKLKRELNKNFEYDYYKIIDDVKTQITGYEYSSYVNPKIGGAAITEEQLKIKSYVLNYAFKYEFIYDYILPFFKLLNDKLKLNSNIKTCIVGSCVLFLNLQEYKDVFDEEDYSFYNSLEKSDLDIHTFIHDENDREKCRKASEVSMFDYKEKLLKNTMFIYYLHSFVVNFFNDADLDIKKEYKIQKLKKDMITNSIIYEDKDKKRAAMNLPINKIKEDLFIRVKEGHKFSEDTAPIDMYRLMTAYSAITKDNRFISCWVELIDVEITMCNTVNNNIYKKTIKIIENVIKVIEYNY